MQDYSTYFKRQSQRTKKNKISRKVTLLFFFFICTFLFLLTRNTFHLFQNSSKSGNLQLQNQKDNLVVRENHITPSQKELVSKIESEIKDINGTFSVYVYDINHKIDFGINENTIITAASVNKIPILAALYFLAGKNKLDLEKIIVVQPSDIQDYGTGSIRYDKPGSSYSIKSLARLMMEKSDNTAAYLLGTQIIGLSKIQELINSWGLTQTDMVENKSSVKDISILLIKMYKGEITTSSLASEMLGFMDKSDFDDRIPEGLPEGIKFYHKTGDEVRKIHDVALVELKNRPYYLGVFTYDITDEQLTKKTISNISKVVYDYMKSL